MERMEYDVLQRLQWYMHPPVPKVFLNHFIWICGVKDRDVFDLANFLVELSVMDYYFTNYHASEIATAALLNATERMSLEMDFHNIKVSKDLFDFNSRRIQECRERLYCIEAQAKEQHAAETAF